MPRIKLIRLRRGDAADWTAANPTLSEGEPGFSVDDNELKIGDGTTDWNGLSPIGGGGGAPSGPAGGALDGTYPNPGLAAAVAGNGLAESADVLSVNVDGSTIEISSDSLRVKADGITANEIAANAVGSSELADNAVDTNALQANAVTAAKVAADVATQAELDAHITDATDAHAASAIGFTPAGTIAATDVQAAIEEVAAEAGSTSFGVEVPSGTVNGVNVTFTLSAAPDPSADLLLWKNGLLMKQGLDYTLSSATITFDSGNIPQTGDILLAAIPTSGGGGGGTTIGRSQLVYRYTVTGSDKASIDTGADTADAGDNDWTGGDLLEIFLITRTDDAAATASLDIILNNDTGANYDRNLVQNVNTTVTGTTTLADTAFRVGTHGSGGTSGYPNSQRITIADYAGTTFNKVGDLTEMQPDGTAGNTAIRVRGWGYRSTSAITRFKVAAQGAAKLKVGSQLLIYKRLSA